MRKVIIGTALASVCAAVLVVSGCSENINELKENARAKALSEPVMAAEETEEAAVAEIAEAAGDMAGDTEPAAAGDRRVREALRDARGLKDREVHRGFRDLTERRERLPRQYMHNKENAVTMRLSAH